MAFREVTTLEVKEVLRLWLLGVPKKGIAAQLGFDVKTVRRYLAVARARGVEPSMRDRLARPSPLQGEPAEVRVGALA
jgi:FixJ family two-component response regulator